MSSQLPSPSLPSFLLPRRPPRSLSLAASSLIVRPSVHSLSSPSSTDSDTAIASSSSAAVGDDHLTNLSDALRLHILSLLPLKYVVCTGALSSRWHDLWKYRWLHPSSLDLSITTTSSGYSLAILNSSPPTPSMSKIASLPSSTSRTTFPPAGHLPSIPSLPRLPHLSLTP